MDPHLEKLQRKIASAIEELPAGQLVRHAPGKWSVAEILEHLYLTYRGTIRGCGRLLETGKPLATKSSWKQRAQAFVVVTLAYMPTGREAPQRARPRGCPPEEVTAEIAFALSEMDRLLTDCAAKFGPRAKIMDHPFLGPFSIQQWRKFHLVHGLHHVKQIHRLREELGAGRI
ncbi:MAG: DUF1569 domain-containing protein [Candidatus Sulfotelmatobacter sp.]